MKWFPLKIYQINLLLQEIETVESKYDNMINEVRFADPKDDNPRKEFLAFREEIEHRIIELDEFYQLNITDARIGAFEKIRNRLAALLKINLEIGNKITRKEYIKESDIQIAQKINFNPLSGIKSNMPGKASKLLMSSSAMRHSTVRKSSSKFGE